MKDHLFTQRAAGRGGSQSTKWTNNSAFIGDYIQLRIDTLLVVKWEFLSKMVHAVKLQ